MTMTNLNIWVLIVVQYSEFKWKKKQTSTCFDTPIMIKINDSGKGG